MNSIRFGSLIVLSLLFTSAPASPSEEWLFEAEGSLPADSDTLQAAFARLKRLEGLWDEAEYGRVIEYRLTGEGSALIEEFIGDPPMTTVYHLDGDDLRLTHYCNAGNQPRMKAAAYRDGRLKFDFVDVTNLSSPTAYHTRTLDIVFQDEDHVVLNFVGLKNGKEIATTHSLTRKHGGSGGE